MAVSGEIIRIGLTEYGDPTDVVAEASESISTPPERIRQLLLNAGNRIGRILRLPENPLAVRAGGVRACDFAGLVRVSPRFELEVAPKFLDSSSVRWREDFFYLAMLSRHGRLLASDRLCAAPGARDDLATLIARSMIGMFQDNKRRPLRTYRRSRVTDFNLDGDVEAEELWLPSPEGYTQHVLTFDCKNQYNAAMLAAIQSLTAEVRQPETRRLLLRIIELLSPQDSRNRGFKPLVPNRSRRWQPLYELAQDVLSGFGLKYGKSTLRAPGFVLHTWRVWEDSIALALRLGMGTQNALSQKGVQLGSRTSFHPTEGREVAVTVTPDVTVFRESEIDYLVDAKYKGRVSDTRFRISEGDLYESLAFAEAAGCDMVVLAYPAVASLSCQRELGVVRLMEKVCVGGKIVAAVDIEVRGISRLGGLREFAANTSQGIQKLVRELRQG